MCYIVHPPYPPLRSTYVHIKPSRQVMSNISPSPLTPPFSRRNHTPLLSITNTTSPILSYPYPPVPPITHTRIHIMCTNIAHFVCGPLLAILRYLHDLCSSSSSSSSAQQSHTGSAESGGVLWTEPYKEPIAVPARVAVSSSPRRVPVVVVTEERARHLSW